jgi:hypothetical protein
MGGWFSVAGDRRWQRERTGVSRSFAGIALYLLASQEWFEEFDGFDEFALMSKLREFDGIEILLAEEAASEIGLAFDCGLGFAAKWTYEDELPFAAFAGPVKMFDQPVRWYVIA